MRRIKSEEVSKYPGYWICSNGTIEERKTGTILPVYANGTCRLLKENGKKENATLHRLVASAFVPRPEGYNFIKFKDGNSNNRDADNLQWVYAVKNMGGVALEIIALWNKETRTKDIASAFNVSPQYVNRIIHDHKKRQMMLTGELDQ
jgi:hypothetical protein